MALSGRATLLNPYGATEVQKPEVRMQKSLTYQEQPIISQNDP